MTTNSTGDDALGTLVTWEEGIGDERRYHIAHVSPAGITLLLKSKDCVSSGLSDRGGERIIVP